MALHFDPRTASEQLKKWTLSSLLKLYTHTQYKVHTQKQHPAQNNEDHIYDGKCYEALHCQKRTLLKQVTAPKRNTARVCCVLL